MYGLVYEGQVPFTQWVSSNKGRAKPDTKWDPPGHVRGSLDSDFRTGTNSLITISVAE